MSQYIENGNISSQAGTRAERVPWRNFAGQLDLRHWNCLWLLLYLAGIAVYLFSFPKFLDDFWFLDKFSDYLSQQGIVLDNKSPDLIANGIPFSEIWETWEWRYLNDNARLSNILVVLLLLTPTWFCHLLSFLCWTYCIIGGLTLAKVDWRRSYLVAPALLAWMFIVPGIDEIASITFQLNYIVPCALGLYILKKIIEPPGTGATQVMVVFLSFLLGWWHEGFSIPFLGGLFGLATVSRSFRKPFYLAIAIALAAGLAIVVTAPAIWQRMGTDYAVVNIGRVLKLSMYFVYLCILVCLIAFCCIRRKSFKPLANPLILFIVVSSVLSALIQLKVNSTPRAMWWGLYSPVIGILYLLNKRAENGPSLKSAGKWMCRLLIIPVLAFLTVVDCYAIQLRQDWNRCVETYISQPERSIFGRSITPDVARLFMINLPSNIFYTTNILFINQGVVKAPQEPFLIIPEELRKVTEKTGTALDGDINARLYEGRVFRPLADTSPDRCDNIVIKNYDVDYGSGYTTRKVFTATFRSEADGRWYEYLQIHPNRFQIAFGELRGIKTHE